MRFKPFILLSVLVCAAVSVSALGIGADGGHYLVSLDGKLHSEEGVERELAEHEYAVVSPSGDSYALLQFEEEAMPLVSTVKVFDRSGRLLYTVPKSGASSVRLADSGAAVFITMIGDGPQAKGYLEFYNPTGTKTGSADIGFPGDGAYFEGNNRYAIISLGDAVHVFDMAEGEETYTLPSTRSIAASGDTLILIGDEYIVAYRGETELWSISHNLYYPRMGLLDGNGSEALIGCHHEVALVNMTSGELEYVWEAPGDFGVTDIDASADFSTIAVGLRTLDGTESVQVLDGSFKLVSAEEHTVARPSGAMPMVAVTDGGVVAIGQGWQTTLKK